MGQISVFPRVYYATYEALRVSVAAADACFNGIWLAFLSQDRRAAIDAVYYDRERKYWTAEYNRQGLSVWERAAFDQHFTQCRRVVVLAAGGGREVLDLRRRDVDVEGFECHPGLVTVANDLLREDGFEPRVRVGPRDVCLPPGGQYDGAIIGWGAYTHIRGRDRRIALLRHLREQLPIGAPVLLSFFAQSTGRRRFTTTARIGNVVRRVVGGEPIEVGDYLMPAYVHYFTRAEIAAECNEAGFEVTHFATYPYAHAVVRARG
jgi:hypothetical protein